MQSVQLSGPLPRFITSRKLSCFLVWSQLRSFKTKLSTASIQKYSLAALFHSRIIYCMQNYHFKTMQYFEFINDFLFLEMDLLFKLFHNIYRLPLNALPNTPPSMDAVRWKTKLLLVWLLFYWMDTSAVKDSSFSCTESCECWATHCGLGIWVFSGMTVWFTSCSRHRYFPCFT